MTQLEYKAIEECGKLLMDETFEYNNVECVVLSDAEKCYIQGYKDAIDKASEWLLKNIHNYLHGTGGGYWFDEGVVLDLRKAMEE